MVFLPRPQGPEPEDFHLSRRGVAGLMFAGYTLAAGPVRAGTITTEANGLFTRTITLPSHGFKLPAYIAMPADARNRPVVVVVSEIFGVHEYIRDVCRRLAKAGYVAIAPAFFVRVADPAPMGMDQFPKIREIVAQATDRQVAGDIEASLDFLASKPDLGQKHRDFANLRRVGITGFCWGGAVVWRALAEVGRIRTGVAWYGVLSQAIAKDDPVPLAIADRVHGPVLGLYGGQDKSIPLADIEAMRAKLKAGGDRKSEIIVYPDAGHGFHADYRSSYNEKDARDGWARLLAWFKTNL